MITISLCMIVKNEEDVLARCLESVRGIADEIVIADTGSTDRTKEIALQFTDQVYDFPWIEDFSAARNFSFSKATMEYVMWLDADDVILEADRENLLALKETLDPAVDVVMMKYHIGVDADGKPACSFYRERILKRERDFRWQDPIHEVITPHGEIYHFDGAAVSHKKMKAGDPKRNLKIYQSMIAKGAVLNPRQKFYYGRELYFNAMYEEAIAVLEDFLADPAGWSENKINCCLDVARCYQALGQEENAVQTLLKSFLYSAPRAEICCELGRYFMTKNDFANAVFWLEVARGQKVPEQQGGFYDIDSYGYTPNMQLCVCYDKLGQRDKARACNELAGRSKPGDKAYLYNVAYFAGLDKKQSESDQTLEA